MEHQSLKPRSRKIGESRAAFAAASVAVAAVFIALLPLQASAQPAEVRDTAAARALFEEGLALADQDDWEGAHASFQRSLELRESPAVRFNYAVSLYRLGRSLEASESLRPLVRLLGEHATVAAQAAALLEEIEGRLARLQITLAGDSAGVQVVLDGEQLSDALLGMFFPIDPGPHAIAAVRGDLALVRETLTLTAGEERELTLTISHTEPTSAPGESEEPRLVRQWWLWTAVGITLALTTTGIVIGVR